MFSKLKNLLGRSAVTMTPSLPDGERVYAIGDIHGRADLFRDLIGQIEADDASRRPAHTTVILLGDLIDRGPDSADVIALAREWGLRREVVYIKGNHEEMLLTSRHKAEALRPFLKFGGRETIMSYGIAPSALQSDDLDAIQATMNAAIPEADFDFLDRFEKLVRIGDYLFVHAGIRPDTPLSHQLGQDCRWIREPFLSHKGDFGCFVIHGHTIVEEPEICSNRAGIDTGAFLHGRLTAIGLEGTDRWFLQSLDHEPVGTCETELA